MEYAIIILSALLILVCAAWISSRFTTKMLVAWMTMNRLRMPNDEELKICASIARKHFFRRSK